MGTTINLAGWLFTDAGAAKTPDPTIEARVTDAAGTATSSVTGTSAYSGGRWSFDSLDDSYRYQVKITAGSQVRYQQGAAKAQYEEIAVMGALKVASGAVGTPSLRFLADADTGLYLIGDGNLGIGTAGVKRVDVNATRVLLVPPLYAADGTVAAPGLAFTSDVDSGLYLISDGYVGLATAGTVRVDVNATRTQLKGVLYLPDGAVGGPAVAFTNDTDTGIYLIGDGNVGLSIAGTKVLDVAATGLTVGVGLTVATVDMLDHAARHGNGEADALSEGSVTATEIANRTRTIFVPGQGFNSSAVGLTGSSLADEVNTSVYGHLKVPSDYVSGGTMTPVVYSTGTGNAYIERSYNLAANGQASDTHISGTGVTTVAITANQVNELAAQTLTSLATGDYIMCKLNRDATSESDTLAAALDLIGWVFTYTADS